MTCSPDAFGTPIFCSNGQCSCAPGYDTLPAPGGGLVCQPIQPEVIGTEARDSGDLDDMNYSCPGICTQDSDGRVGPAVPWATVGSIYKAWDLVPVHGIAPGGEAFMPVWGYQANFCGNHGVPGARCQGGSNNGAVCSVAADCPGGFCTRVGTCQDGSNNGGTCLGDADCPSGTCRPLGMCSTTGGTCSNDTDCPGGTCKPARTWAGCAPDPFAFCFGLQDSDEGDFDFNNCESTEGCGDCGDVDPGDWAPSRSGSASDLCGKCVSDFTDAWPYIDRSNVCAAGTIPNPFHELGGVTDPARIDFPNNVIVYRAPTRWEEFSDNAIDHDYTWDTSSVGHELHDTDTQFDYHRGCPDATHGRVHTEFDRFESVNHFTSHDWGAANLWWRKLRSVTDDTCCFCSDPNNAGLCNTFFGGVCAADPDSCTIGNSGADRTNTTRCFVKSFVNPTLTCPTDEDVDADCSLHDPMVVTVGVPSLDCADDAYQGTDEIHPVLGMAIRIQEDPGQLDDPKPEQWAFFYRQTGGTGPCGGSSYSRCLSSFKLPLGLPVVPANGVLSGADVHVDWHAWRTDDSTPTDVALGSTFDLTNGTVLDITLPHFDEGVVGLVTITPSYDRTAPTIGCPANINTPPDLGKCTAKVTFPAPTISDDCSVSAACNPPSGSSFPIGTTKETCTATDQAGMTSSCNFNVAVTAGNKCPHDQGYWKNHPALWPVTSLTLGTGTVPYGKAQLVGILNNSTTGDASVILARAEIATLLSLANGSNPTPICGTIADADAALGASTVPAKIGPKTVLGQRMVADAASLTSYNAGSLTPGCTP